MRNGTIVTVILALTIVSLLFINSIYKNPDLPIARIVIPSTPAIPFLEESTKAISHVPVVNPKTARLPPNITCSQHLFNKNFLNSSYGFLNLSSLIRDNVFSETEILELNTVVAGQLKILHDSEMEKAKKTEEHEEDGILYVKLMLQPNLEVMKMAKLNIENAFSKFCGESETYLFSAAILSRPAFQTFELTHWAELASSDTETIVQISSKTGGPQIKSGDYGSAIGFVLSGIQGENSFSQFSSNKDKDLFALRWGYLEPKFAQ